MWSMSENATNEPHRLVAASVGVAIPKDRARGTATWPSITATGRPRKQAGDYAEDLAASMLATILGVDFDRTRTTSARHLADERQDRHHAPGDAVGIGDREGLWTSVVAAAVFAE
jgi:arginine decarboxylase